MSSEINKLYEFGAFRLNAETSTLWRENELIQLSPKAFELLKLIVERQGEVVSKQEIFDAVWADTFVEEGVLTQNIYTLRQALGNNENGKPIIENLARRGYRLNLPVRAGSNQEPVSAAHAQIQNAEEPQAPMPQAAPKPPSRSISKYLFPALAIFLIPLSGFLAYRAFFTQKADAGMGLPGNMKFQRLSDTGDASYLTISADGDWAAYTRNFNLFLKDLRANSEVKINIESDAKPSCLQFSPDANYIFFGTLRNRDQRGNIYQIPRAGGKPVLIAENIWSGFSISPDGSEIAYVRKFPGEGKESLIIRKLADGSEQEIKTLNAPETFYWNNYPAYSADGKRIAMAVVSQSEHFIRLLLIARDDRSEKEMKFANFRNVEQVVWNSAGDELTAAANDGNNFQLWRISLEDGSQKRITNDLNSYLGIAISADRKKLISRQRIYFSNIWVSQKNDLNNLKQVTTGTSRNDGLQGLCWIDEDRLIYTSNAEKIRDWNLWMLNTADETKQKITSDTAIQNDYPVISPDRKTIYFSSDRNKENRIWRIGLDGSNPEQVTFGESESHHYPQISADGAWLYFIIKNAKSSTIGRKSLMGNSFQELSGEKKYAPGSFLSISPDGKFLAFENLQAENPSGQGATAMQVGIISSENPEDIYYQEIPSWQKRAEWGRDGKFLDFVSGNIKSNGIMREGKENGSQISQLLPESEGNIFNFAWSPSGERLAISRGQLLRDVVLISNFE